MAIGPAQPPAVVSPAAQPAGNDVAKLYASLSLESIVFDDACKADIRASQRAMLRYYTSCFAIMLSTNMDNNCFLSGELADPPSRPLSSPSRPIQGSVKAI